jgi:hypothetical protein
LDDLSIGDGGGTKISHYHCVVVYICFYVLQSMFDEIEYPDIGCI